MLAQYVYATQVNIPFAVFCYFIIFDKPFIKKEKEKKKTLLTLAIVGTSAAMMY